MIKLDDQTSFTHNMLRIASLLGHRISGVVSVIGLYPKNKIVEFEKTALKWERN